MSQFETSVPITRLPGTAPAGRFREWVFFILFALGFLSLSCGAWVEALERDTLNSLIHDKVSGGRSFPIALQLIQLETGGGGSHGRFCLLPPILILLGPSTHQSQPSGTLHIRTVPHSV